MRLDLSGLRHVDHACAMALTNWVEQHNAVIARVPEADEDTDPDIERAMA